jgi:hypothetical protein
MALPLRVRPIDLWAVVTITYKHNLVRPHCRRGRCRR